METKELIGKLMSGDEKTLDLLKERVLRLEKAVLNSERMIWLIGEKLDLWGEKEK